MLKYLLWLSIGLLLLSCEKAVDQGSSVRVRIIHEADSLSINFLGNWSVLDADAEKSLLLDAATGDSVTLFTEESGLKFLDATSRQLTFIPSDGAELEIADVPYGDGWWWEGKEDRIYQDTLLVHFNRNGAIDVVVHTPMERYLLGVVPYEIGTDAPLEALKAQAVAARSEAVVALRSGLYSGPNHDLTSDVECQVFAGNKKRSSRSDSAVVLTAGRYLVENGQPINAYYASNCGGMSANIAEVWPNRPRPASYITPLSDVVGSREALDFSSEDAFLDYLNGKISEDVWCNPNRGVELPDFSQRNHRWERVMSLQEFEAMMMERNPNMGAFERMEIGRRGKSGRIHQLILHYENAQEVVNTELAIRQLWKPALRSSAFIWQQEEEQIKLIGAGWGHGIGLCQSGAIAMAKTGYGYLAILQHYYPAAMISKGD